MKKIYTFLLLTSSLFSFAQVGPTIEGTYLPVRGSSIREVWENTYNNTLAIPDSGENKVWNYYGQFSNSPDTFQIKTFHPDSSMFGRNYHQYFPTATHASFLRSPLNNLTDSLFSYFIIDADGLHMLGGFNIKTPTADNAAFDTTIIITPSEYMSAPSFKFQDVKYDTTHYVTYGKFGNTPIKIKGTQYKKMTGYSYGRLIMPDSTVYDNVLLAKQAVHAYDSIFPPGFTTPFTIDSSNHYIDYNFCRNNTFGSAYLMYIHVNYQNTLSSFGWYTLPIDYGYISGTVYDSLINPHKVTHGEAFLYREHSNFSKNDILDKSPIDTSGNYRFDSIPYGEYRVSVRPDLSFYPNALTTYFGDTTNGNDAASISTLHPTFFVTNHDSPENNIHLQYHTDSVGYGTITGSLDLNLGFGIAGSPNVGNGIRSNPIPGIDVIVKKKPGGIVKREVKTGLGGLFTLSDLSDGHYDLFVDIPGLFMDSTYEFTISGGTLVNCLDFTSGKDSIHPTCNGTVNLHDQFKNNDLLDVFPNPYSSYTTIKMNITEPCNVLLEVYNLLGEKIQTIEKCPKQPGIYSYNFNAKSLSYSSGIYFVKLSTGNKTSVLKIIEQ